MEWVLVVGGVKSFGFDATDISDGIDCTAGLPTWRPSLRRQHLALLPEPTSVAKCLLTYTRFAFDQRGLGVVASAMILVYGLPSARPTSDAFPRFLLLALTPRGLMLAVR